MARTFNLRGATVSDAYHRGNRVKLRGTKYDGKLYDADGDPVTNVYLDDGDWTYEVGDYCGLLYEDGGDEIVSVGTDEYTPALYEAGKVYSGGLYTNFTLATVTTKNITALTARKEDAQ